MCVTSNFRVLVVGGRRVLLKLSFQVFIVLSPADEAGTCRVYEGARRVVWRCWLVGYGFLVDVCALS
jgi:hypothetical protein